MSANLFDVFLGNENRSLNNVASLGGVSMTDTNECNRYLQCVLEKIQFNPRDIFINNRQWFNTLIIFIFYYHILNVMKHKQADKVRFFSPSKLHNTHPNPNETLPPPTTRVPVFSRFSNWYQHTPVKKGTPPPSTEAHIFSRFLNWMCQD